MYLATAMRRLPDGVSTIKLNLGVGVGDFILIRHQLKVYEGELVCGAASRSSVQVVSALLIVLLAWIRLHGSGYFNMKPRREVSHVRANSGNVLRRYWKEQGNSLDAQRVRAHVYFR